MFWDDERSRYATCLFLKFLKAKHYPLNVFPVYKDVTTNDFILHILMRITCCICHTNKGASSSVSDVDSYVTIRKSQYSVLSILLTSYAGGKFKHARHMG